MRAARSTKKSKAYTKRFRSSFSRELSPAYEHLIKNFNLNVGHFDSFPQYLAYIYKITLPNSSIRNNIQVVSEFVRDHQAMAPIVAAFQQARANKQYLAPISCQDMGYDVCGDFVDVGRYMGGEPECMCQYDAAERPTKFLTFNIRTAATNNAFNYYGMVLDLIDYLESAGTRCRINLQFNHNTSGSKWAYRSTGSVMLKDFCDPLNIHEFCAFFLSEAMNIWAKTSADCLLGMDTYGVDGNDVWGDVEQPEDPEAINIPSAWFRQYYGASADSLDMKVYLEQLKLSRLLAE